MEDYREQSEFNMAIFTLGRLNYSLFLCAEHFRMRDMDSLFHEMLNLYMEVSTEMNGDILALTTDEKLKGKKEYSNDELEVMEKYIEEVEPLVEKWKKQRGFDGNTINKELYTKLRYMNMLLRKIMKDSGLLLKMKEDARFALK